MKSIKTAFVLLLVLTLCSAFSKKDASKPVYMYSVSASFLDTVVYITDIQLVDSVKLEKGLLPNWSAYSYQLKNYLEQVERLPNRTCAVYFSEDKKKLEKEALKLKNKYLKNKIMIKSVNPEQFKFRKAESD